MRRWSALLVVALLSVAMSTRPLLAQEHHGDEAHGETSHDSHDAHGGHDDHAIPWGTLLFSFANFAMFATLMARKVWPGIKQSVAERRDTIVQTMQEAAAAKADAEKLRNEWQARLANLQTEINGLREAAKKDAETERARILAAAEKTAEVIRRDAERAAAAEVRKVQQQLRAEMVGEAIKLAESTVKAGWTSNDQQNAVTEFVQRVQS